MVASSQSTNLPSRQIRWWLSTAMEQASYRWGELKILATHAGAPPGRRRCLESARRRPFSESGANLRHAAGEQRIHRLASTTLNQDTASNRHQLGGATGEGKDGGGVWIAHRGRAGNIDTKRCEVGVLAGLERSDARVHSQCAGAPDRRQLECLVGSKSVVTASRGAVDEDGETRFVENVHSIVARHRIRSHSEGNLRAYEREQRRDSVSEFRVRRGAVGDRAAVARDRRNVGGVDPHAVDEQRARLERSTLLEQRDG